MMTCNEDTQIEMCLSPQYDCLPVLKICKVKQTLYYIQTYCEYCMPRTSCQCVTEMLHKQTSAHPANYSKVINLSAASVILTVERPSLPVGVKAEEAPDQTPPFCCLFLRFSSQRTQMPSDRNGNAKFKADAMGREKRSYRKSILF